jgi:tetratricopeptide (TPR) repeat protein
VRTLSQTGLVGTALLAVAIGAALWAVLRRNRGPVQVALVTAFVAWFLHAQGDWLWEMPALGAIAFGLLGVAVALSTREEPSPGAAARRVWPWVVVGCAAVGALALAPPWLSARYEAAALSTWRTSPAAAIEDLRRAASLNPLSDRPWVIAGAIASRSDDYPAMRAHFAAAVERNPRNWYSRLELAMAAALTGDRRLALAEIDSALALNPNDAVLRRVARTIRRGGIPDPSIVDAEYREQTEAIAG